jgi:hypothetical protein
VAAKKKLGGRNGGSSVAGNGEAGAGLGRRVVPDVPQQDPSARDREREEFVGRLMLAGLPLGQIVEQAARSVGLDRKGTRAVYERLCERWTADVEADLKHARSQAVNRLRRDLAQMRNPLPLRHPHSGELLTAARLDQLGQRVKVGGVEVREPIPGEVDWRSVNAHERLLASIEGTLRPVEVSVDVIVSTRRSLATLVATLSEGDLQELEDEQRLLEEQGAGAGEPR